LIAEINADNIPGVTASLETASTAGFTSLTFTNSLSDVGLEISNTNANVSIGASSLDDTTASSGTASGVNNSGATTSMSYVFASGGDTSIDLSSTDLTSSADAQSALKQINSAVTYVAAQDGYIGAQINTLEAISTVMSTQQENVLSAQNAIQATDYATATSNMSKYEVLTQTGIAALAQANSVQQEVTKLMQ
jgi:flagellin